MNDIAASDEDTVELPGVDELTILKQRARMMGIEFSNNIGLETLRERVRAKMEAIDKIENPVVEVPTSIPAIGETEVRTKPMTIREQLRRDELKLVRVRITNLDPKKKDLSGEIFTVANEYLGTVTKFIPFGELTDEGYHIPHCIYTQLEAKRFLNIRVRKSADGRDKIEQGWVREYALEVLPQLTKAEIAKLAMAQQAAGVLNPT